MQIVMENFRRVICYNMKLSGGWMNDWSWICVSPSDDSELLMSPRATGLVERLAIPGKVRRHPERKKWKKRTWTWKIQTPAGRTNANSKKCFCENKPIIGDNSLLYRYLSKDKFYYRIRNVKFDVVVEPRLNAIVISSNPDWVDWLIDWLYNQSINQSKGFKIINQSSC